MNRSSTNELSQNTLAKSVNNYFRKSDAMKKLRGLVLMLFISLSLFGLTACQDGGNNATYEQITPQQAKTIMDTETDYIIIDARTAEFISKAIKAYCN